MSRETNKKNNKKKDMKKKKIKIYLFLVHVLFSLLYLIVVEDMFFHYLLYENLNQV